MVLFKSSSLQVWPILCSFHAFAPFIAALYWTIKTSPVQDDLSDFLQQDGIFHGGKTLQVTVKAFICDTPAWPFLKCLKSHNSYITCECSAAQVEATMWDELFSVLQHMVFTRSEAEFSRLAYKDHQMGKFPLTLAGIPPIQPFALDYMHLVCLGGVRRMLQTFQQRSEI